MDLREMDKWDPMLEAYRDTNFNSYHSSSYQKSSSTSGDPMQNSCFHVKNIPADLTEDGLMTIFSKYGKVKSVKKMVSKSDNPAFTHGTTFGFINFYTPEEAHATLSRVKGGNLYGMHVTMAKPKKQDKDNDHAAKDNINRFSNCYAFPPQPVHPNVYDPNRIPYERGRSSQCDPYRSYSNPSNAGAGRGLLANPYRTHHPFSGYYDDGMHFDIYNHSGVGNFKFHDGPDPYQSREQPHDRSYGNQPPRKHYNSHQQKDNTPHQGYEKEDDSTPVLKVIENYCKSCNANTFFMCSICKLPFCSDNCLASGEHMGNCYNRKPSNPMINKSDRKYMQSETTGKPHSDATLPCESQDGERTYSRNGMIQKPNMHKGPNKSKKPMKRNPNEVNPNQRDGKGNCAQSVHPKKKISGFSPKKPSSSTGETNDDIAGFCPNKESSRKKPEPTKNCTDWSELVDKYNPLQNDSGKTTAAFTEDKNILVPVKVTASDLTLPSQLSNNEMVIICYVESPHQFWVHRVKDLTTLSEIQIELNAFRDQKASFHQPSVNDICGSFFPADNCPYRSKITKLNSDDTCEVLYIDFGNSCTIATSTLFYLTPKFTSHPAMAISCKFSDIKPIKSSWSDDDKKSVEIYAESVNSLKAVVLDAKSIPLGIDLLTESGVSVSAILVEQQNAQWFKRENVELVSNTIIETEALANIPSVMKHLKEGADATLTPVFVKDDNYCIWITNIANIGSQFDAFELKLQNSLKKEITSTAQKGSVGVTLSTELKKWCRSYLVNKTSDLMMVRHIDYGITEKVLKFYSLDLEYSKVHSPLLWLVKPKPTQQVYFQKLLEKSVHTLVYSVSGTSVELSTVPGGLRIQGFPWTYRLKLEAPMLPFQGTPQSKPDSDALSVNEKISFSSRPHSFLQFDIAKTVLSNRPFASSGRTKVKVSWFKCPKEFFVQKVSDLKELSDLTVEINSLVNSTSPKSFVPSVNEIICAKYAEDGQWYRCLVVKMETNKQYEVFFIDYGNYGLVSIEDVRKLSQNHSCPKFCICVSLQAPPPMAKKDLVQFMLDKEFDLEVIDSSANPPVVQLCHDGQNIFKKLLPHNIQSNSIIGNTSTPVAIPKMTAVPDPLAQYDGAQIKVVSMDVLKNINIGIVHCSAEFKIMQEKLNEACAKCSVQDFLPSVGDVACACYKREDITTRLVESSGVEEWYRAHVTKISGITCSVDLFDIGCVIETNVHKLKPLAKEFLLPMFCHKITMDNVPKEYLTDDVLDVLYKQEWTLKLTNKQSTPMMAKFYSGDMCVNDVLVQIDVEPCTSTEAPENYEKLPACTTVSLNSEKNSLGPQGGKVQASICSYSDLKYVDFPDGRMSVIMLHIESADSVFCAPFIDENFQASNDLTTELNLYCNDDPKEHQPQNEGEIVIAKFQGAWYRAVVGAQDPPNYWVQFVDYGNSSWLKKADIRKMEKRFLELPVQAHPAIICGLSASENLEVLKQVESIISQSPVMEATVTTLPDKTIMVDVPELKNKLIEKGLISKP